MSTLNRGLALDIVHVTEQAALAAAKLTGRGDKMAADQAAVDAMRRAMEDVAIAGTVVIGEGEMDEAPMLYIGEEVGAGGGPAVDIAVDPLEGTTICAKSMPNALAVMAIAPRGTFLHAPDMYMDKIAIGPGYPCGVVDLDASVSDNLKALAQAKGVDVSEITACVLDRDRHKDIISEIRSVGAAVQLIPDGDIAGVIWAGEPAATGIDIYLGSGGAPEGVLAAAAIKCIGGQMQARARKMGIEDVDAKLELSQMVSGDAIFSATGVTSGQLLAGVTRRGAHQETETLVFHCATGSRRLVRSLHGLKPTA